MWQEEVLQRFFDAWLRKDAAALKSLLSPEVIYTESDGPCYVGMGQVIKWFTEWNRVATVLEWTPKRYTHRQDSTLVEWHFRWDFDHVENSCDGISVVTFDDLQKIRSLREFQASSSVSYPLGIDPIVEAESEGVLTSATDLAEVKVLQYNDDGMSTTSNHPLYRQQQLEAAGVNMKHFEQRMYHARQAGTLYGIRFQNDPRAQNKLVYCIRGRGVDYAVDLRKNSPTYLRWTRVEISADNGRQVYIPKGFGHAFLALEDNTCMVCCFDEPFDDRYSRTLAWNDPQVGIQYPVTEPILNSNDAAAPMLDECDICL